MDDDGRLVPPVSFWFDAPWKRHEETTLTDGMPASRLGRQIAEIAAMLNALGIPFALIGGLALAAHKVVRATQDVDLLVDRESSEAIDTEMARLGYRCLHRGAEAANYARRDERMDFLFASRPAARRLLASARQTRSALGTLRVVSAEGLIGLKLQALANEPGRTQDLEDIRALLRMNREALDMEEVRSYFALFGREALLQELLDEAR